jgi:O-antigen ligase
MQPAALSPAPSSQPARPAAARAAAPGAGPDPLLERLPAISALFFGYVFTIAIEYSGLSIQVPQLGASKIPTLVAYGLFFTVLSKVGIGAFGSYRQMKMLLTFVIWTAASVLWAVVRSIVPVTARFLYDYFTFAIITVYLVDTKKRIDTVSFVMSLVIIMLSVANQDKLSGARLGSFWAPYFMGDGNDFAWGVLTLLVFPLNLLLGKGRRLITRGVGAAAILLGGQAVLGTQSRGAFLAMVAGTLFYLAFVSKRKVLGGTLVVTLGLAVLFASPEGYGDRMGTIAHYEEDDSARQRTVAWKAAFQMAQDYPLGVGGGNFSAAYGHFYIPADAHGFGAFRWMSAHSVYFRVLAEYGFGGLFLLLSLFYFTFRENLNSAKRVRERPEIYDMPAMWPSLLNIAFAMYCVGAMFLGGFNYPHIFLMVGLSLGTKRIVDIDSRAADAKAAAGGDTPAAGAPSGGRPAPDPRIRVPAPRRPLPAGGGRFF